MRGEERRGEGFQGGTEEERVGEGRPKKARAGGAQEEEGGMGNGRG